MPHTEGRVLVLPHKWHPDSVPSRPAAMACANRNFCLHLSLNPFLCHPVRNLRLCPFYKYIWNSLRKLLSENMRQMDEEFSLCLETTWSEFRTVFIPREITSESSRPPMSAYPPAEFERFPLLLTLWDTSQCTVAPRPLWVFPKAKWGKMILFSLRRVCIYEAGSARFSKLLQRMKASFILSAVRLQEVI